MRLKNFLKYKAREIVRRQDGVAFIEAILTLPFLLLLFFGCIEVTRYVLITQKLDKTTSEIANIVTQNNSTTLNDAQMLQLIDSVQYMMYPYTTMTSGANPTPSNTRIIVTDIQNTNLNTSSSSAPTPIIMWQFCSNDTGSTLQSQSQLGHFTPTSPGPGTRANLAAAGFSSNFVSDMQSGEELIVAEVYFAYQPVTNENLGLSPVLYRTAAFTPRLSSLTGYNPGSASQCP